MGEHLGKRGPELSVRATSWALYELPDDPPITVEAFVVLFVLADHADPYGTDSYPSQSLIMEATRLSRRTVQRRLVELEASGLIRRGDQSRVDRIPANRRPIVWDLALHRRRTVEAHRAIREAAAERHTSDPNRPLW